MSIAKQIKNIIHYIPDVKSKVEINVLDGRVILQNFSLISESISKY